MDFKMTVRMQTALVNFANILNSSQRGNVIREAKRSAGHVVRKRAQELAPVKSGALKRALGLKGAVKSTRRKNVYVIAGLKSARANPFYARYVEMGHKKRGRGKGEGWGWVEGAFYLSRAARQTESAALEAFKTKFREGVETKLIKIKSHQGRY